MDIAENHLNEAISMNIRMGAQPWAARARADLAALLLERDEPGDREQATVQLGLAAATCEELGMPILAERIKRLRVESPVLPTSASAGQGTFRQEGEYWTVVFAGDAFRLRDTKGLRYLSRLLQQPGRELHALDLVSMVEGGAPSAVAPSRSEDELHLATFSDGIPVLDELAKAAYRNRLQELEEDLDEATAWSDSARSATIREEMDFMREALTSAVGLGGRDRKAGSAAERARVNITRAIRSALMRVREHSTALADHLDATIHTGTYCSYSPDPRSSTNWHA